MHVAVEKGAKEGESFAGYLAFLEQQGYVTPPMKPWVEVIRRTAIKQHISLMSLTRKEPKVR